jgi:hypothetical protein
MKKLGRKSKKRKIFALNIVKYFIEMKNFSFCCFPTPSMYILFKYNLAGLHEV